MGLRPQTQPPRRCDNGTASNKACGLGAGRTAPVFQVGLRHTAMDTRSKIISLERAGALFSSTGEERDDVVVARGCFDLLSAEHCRELARARERGKYLVVAVYSDSEPRRTVFSQLARAQMVAALAVVDYVVICDESQTDRVVSPWRPTEVVEADPASSRDLIGDVLQRYSAD